MILLELHFFIFYIFYISKLKLPIEEPGYAFNQLSVAEEAQLPIYLGSYDLTELIYFNTYYNRDTKP